ncbi:MAG: ribosomal protein S18-alanine N-acetyltransferase [Acidimicrobiales bacterium]
MAVRIPDPLSAYPVVHLAPMRRRHLRQVLRIEAQVYPRPWSLSLFMSELTLRATRSYRIARTDGAVAGYAGLMLAGPDAHVTTLAVDPRWHRRGIGTLLLAGLAANAVERGCQNLTLEVRVANAGAQSLYHAFGFAPAGIRKNYYVETNEDALIMWANDIDTPEYADRVAELVASRAARLAPPED